MPRTTFFSQIDWVLAVCVVPIIAAGLITMKSFGVEEGLGVFGKQLIWVVVGFCIFFIFSKIDFRFLKRTDVVVALFAFFCGLLLLLFILGHTAKGAQSWFDFGGFSFQPSDMMKIVVIIILAKYFSRRHVEIAHMKHIFISALYAFIPFTLVFLQPDFGSAIIILFIWFGMALISGISRKHLIIVCMLGLVAFGSLWLFVFQPYQKARILNFVHPLRDIRGTGYNAYQSVIAVGSGEFLGKGIGHGTQSHLQFLPEYETDFIFAAFAEEWGFLGAIILLIFYAVLLWRVLDTALHGSSNFEILFGIGFAIFIMSHILINIGMNIGLMPVTGITLPFMSYGGSHLVAEFMALGILSSMRSYSRAVHRDDLRHEFVGY
jgi:rod shape determining protein RodA